jgi:hypothetical protein
MQQRPWSRRVLFLASILGMMVAAPTAARAAGAGECPERAPESIKERRAVAQQWFSRAEAAETAGDDVAAVKSYSCSFELVPHPSTAYKLARAAERAGDLQTALAAHRDYLTLKPDAPDRADVEARMISLQGRLVAAGDTAPPPPPRARPAPPPPSVEAAPAPASVPLLERMETTEWVVAGVGAAALVSGVVFNIGARAQMSNCRDMARANNIVGARDACDRASPFAYTSYVLFGAAAAAAVADVVLLWTKPERRTSLGMVPVRGGAALTAQGRF